MYASLNTLLNFLIMKKQQKRKNNNSQDHLIKHLKTEQARSWWDKFCAGQKVS